MIERRRLFFESDFLRDITQFALFPELLCNLHVHYQETMESRLPNETVILTGRHNAKSLPKLALPKFANWILCSLPHSRL